MESLTSPAEHVVFEFIQLNLGNIMVSIILPSVSKFGKANI